MGSNSIRRTLGVLAVTLAVLFGICGTSTQTVTALSTGPVVDGVLEIPETTVEIDPDIISDMPDADEALGMYIDELADTEVFAQEAQNGSKKLGDRLSGQNKKIYGFLVDAIGDIASGKRASTVADIPIGDILEKTEFTEDDLGVRFFDSESGTFCKDDVNKAINDTVFTYDIETIVNALLVDCPYEFYWYDKSIGKGTSCDLHLRYNINNVDGEPVLYFYDDGIVSVYFTPSAEYAGEDSDLVDTDKTGKTVEVVNNARAIVEENENRSDYEKITAYKDAICELTDYNFNAIEEDYDGGYGNPWQMIYVFDNDPKTKVVCEGYSKAFKFLCDMSDFRSSDVCSRIVWGDCGGPHMWNVVTMEDNENYIADITNTDGADADIAPFLVGAGGSAATGYSVNGYPTYSYDKEMFSMFDEEELEISDEDYVPEGMPDYDDGEITDVQLNFSKLPLEITEGTNRELINYLDEDTQEEYSYFRYEIPPLRDYLSGLSVTFENGVTREYKWDGSRDAFRCKGKNDIKYEDLIESVSTDQSYSNEWKGGETHAITAENEDYEFQIPVKIVKRSISDIKIGLNTSPINILEEPENEDGSGAKYTIPNLYRYLTDLTITETNGKVTEYEWDRSSLNFVNGTERISYKDVFWSIKSDQSITPWKAGEEHAFYADYLGYSAEIPVRVISDTVSEIKLNLKQNPVEIAEKTGGKKDYIFDEENFDDGIEYYNYFLPDLRDKLNGLTIKYKDGITNEYVWDKASEKFTCDGKDPIAYNDLFEEYSSDQRRKPWNGGETHSFTVDYLGKSIIVPVAIKHVYVKKTVAARIGIAGKTYDECSKCGKKINVKTIAALKPGKTSIKSVSAGKRSFTVKWTKKAYTGYQIRYSTKSSMSGSKTVTVTKSSTVSKTVKNLKAKKKYYVQVRTYKTVSGKKYYSAWSTKKSIRTR